MQNNKERQTSFFELMKKYQPLTYNTIYILIIFFSVFSNSLSETNLETKYSGIVRRIFENAIKDSSAWERLAYMCDTFGPRLSGSENLDRALSWIYEELKKDGFERVSKDEVLVPHWVRGKEFCELVSPRKSNMPILAYGGSVSTPPNGITAPVVVVNSFKEAVEKKEEIRNKILVFNVPFTNYGETVQYRWWGAIRGAEEGALAVLVRSVSPIGFQMPHTGSMAAYNDSLPKIPNAAITAEDAELLDRLYKRGQNPVVHIYLESQHLTDAVSYNVMGELKGSEKPDEIIAIGGHIDSWDVGTGAQDDASGCIATWEAVKLLKRLGLTPKRTIRQVFWTNEENGSRGGKDYLDKHGKEKHFLMFEFDSGVFPPSGIGFTGPDSLFNILKSFEPLLQQIDSINIHKGGGGVDIEPMMKTGIPGMHLNTNDKGKYFWYHHSPSDTPDKVDPKDLNKCIAAIAAIIYLYADL